MTLTCSNIQRNIRALGLIPSNLQVNYQRIFISVALLVVSVKSGQILG
jgi:hypothetical protein